MARRRVNLQFLLIVTGLVLGGAVLAFAAKKFIFRENPKRYIDQARREVREGKLVDARFNFEKALSLESKDPGLNVEMADCLHELTRIDSNVIGSDRKYYEQALAIDPTYRPALQKLMKLEIEAVEFDPRPASFRRLHDLAQKVLNLPPQTSSDPKIEADQKARLSEAKAYLHISTVAGWVMGIIEPDEVINEEMKALVELQRTDPSNPDVPYYLANAYMKQARELKVQGADKEKDANVLFDKAVAVFDQALQAQPKNAVMYIRFYTVLRYANQLISENDNVPDKQKYVNRMKEVLQRARAFVTKDDPAFTDVYIESAKFSLRQNDPQDAEKVIRELVLQRPDDQTARLAMADLLHVDPVKRGEVIELLKKEITDPGMTGVIAQKNKRELELQTYLDLSKYLIEQWYATADTAKRAEIHAEIKKYYDRLAEREPLHSETLKLKAKIVLMDGGPDAAITAISIIEEAINSFGVRNASVSAGNRKDWELEFMLAKCYFESRQTGEAMVRLVKITEAVPQYSPAHMLLAQVMLENQAPDGAQEQIKILHKLTPNDPALSRLDLVLLSMLGKKEQLLPNIQAMPEKTLEEMRIKAKVAMTTGYSDEALRVLNLVLEKEPADFDTVDAVARLYWRRGNKAKSLEVVEAAVAKAPSNLQLDVLYKELKGESPEVIMKAMSASIASVKDDFTREMKWFDFYFAQNNTPEAVKHLDVAEKIKPNDAKVLDLRFQFAANEQKWDRAETYISKLTAINADQAHGQIYRYRMAMGKGDIDAAGNIAQDLVKALPQYARSWICLADTQRLQGSYQEAITSYTFALEKQSGNLDAFRGLIECEYALSKPADALRYIQMGLKLNPRNTYLMEEKIKYDLAYGEPKDAVAPRLKYRDDHIDSSEAWLLLGGAYFQLAQRLTDANKIDVAKQYVEQAKDTFTRGSEKWPDEKLFYAYLADLATFIHDLPLGEKALRDLAHRPAYENKVEPRLLLADYFLRTIQLDAAEATMKEAIELAKDTPEQAQKTEVKQKLAAFYVQQGKFDEALAQLDPKSTDQKVQLQRVETLVASGKTADAQVALQVLLGAHPNDAQLLAMNGFLLNVSQKPTEAMAALNASLAIDPKNQTALYQRGRLNLSRGLPGADEAIRDLTAARDLAPRNVLTRLALAEAFLTKNDNDSCIREMTDAVRSQPGNKEVRMKLLQLYARQAPPRWIEVERLLKETSDMPEFVRDPDWSRAASTMWLSRKEPEKAVKAMEASVKLALSLNMPLEKLGTYQQDYLNVLLQAKKYNELLANCNSLLADPRVADKIWWVYQLRAIAYRYTDQKDKALLDFDKAINIAVGQKSDEVVMTLIDSIADTVGIKEATERLRQKVEAGDSHWRVILAYLYLKGEDYLNAVTVMDKVMADTSQMTDRERDAALDIAGLIYMQAREYDKAVGIYKKILVRMPENIPALNNLACITGELRENPAPKEAIKFSQKAVTLLEERNIADANIFDTHGWMLTLDQQYDDGIHYLRLALDKQAFPECQYHLGFALLQKKQPSDAINELERAKQLNMDRRKKNQRVDEKLEAKIEEALTKAKQLAAATP